MYSYDIAGDGTGNTDDTDFVANFPTVDVPSVDVEWTVEYTDDIFVENEYLDGSDGTATAFGTDLIASTAARLILARL